MAKPPAPPEITSGSFVSWSGGKGRVDLIVTNGKVPGIEDDVEGTAKSPAARVVVWENEKATRKKIGAAVHTLKRIAPIGGGNPFAKKASDPAALVSLLAEHEAKCEDMDLPEYARITGTAVKSAYDRGLVAWPGETKTGLSAQEWAYGRVEHLVKVAAGDVMEADQTGNDTDLLAEQHPSHTAPPAVVVPAAGTDPATAAAIAAGDPDADPLLVGEGDEGSLVPETPPPGTEPVDPPDGTEPVAPQPGEGADGEGDDDADETVEVEKGDVDAEIKSLLEGIDGE